MVAHEFSHILNGDMRLNVRLIGVLFGIQMLAGVRPHADRIRPRVRGRARARQERRSARRSCWLLGLALFVVGYIGIFFGRLIKAAVSRQREFLADASAVQFTRNPDGIGGALRKIGGFARHDGPGSRIDNPNAEQLSHLFLGAARPALMNGWLATHPPLAERLRRIYGRGVELLEAPEIAEPAPAAEPMLADIPYLSPVVAGAQAPQPGPAEAVATTMALPAAGVSRLPIGLRNAVREPQTACAVVYALLLGPASERPPQLALLQAAQPQQAKLAVWLAQTLARWPKSARLPLLDLAMPALRQLSNRQQRILLETVDQLIAADARVTLAEFVLQTILQRRLGAHAGRAVPVRFGTLAGVRAEVALLLSLVAHVAAASATEPSATAVVEPAALQRFLHGAAGCAQLGLTARDFTAASALGFVAVRAALERANQLAPRAKPELVEAWLAVALDGKLLSAVSADVLRALCAAIDGPIPAVVAASYADCFRGQA